MSRYYWFVFLWFFIGCVGESRSSFTYIKPPSVVPITLSEACDLKDKENCLLSFKESYQIGEHTFSPVDIVFILDVSLSTEDDFSKISSGFQSLISSIRHLDWRIYFTTADHGDHTYFCMPDKLKKRLTSTGQWQSYCLVEDRIFPDSNSWEDYKGNEPKFGNFMKLQLDKKILDRYYLDSTLPLYDHIFSHTLERDHEDPCQWPPFCQGSHEQPLRVMKTILEKQPRHNIFRQDAQVIFFVVTEESERREDPKNATTAQEVLFQFEHAFQNQNKSMIVYGVSIQSQRCLVKQSTWDTSYSIYLDRLVKKTNGMSIDICSEDYSEAFSKISNQLRKSVNEIPLTFPAYISSSVGIDVTVQDQFSNIIETEWVNNKEDQSISFSQVLPEKSQLEIQYYYEGGSSMRDISNFYERKSLNYRLEN